jgi:hypothetical protein
MDPQGHYQRADRSVNMPQPVTIGDLPVCDATVFLVGPGADIGLRAMDVGARPPGDLPAGRLTPARGSLRAFRQVDHVQVRPASSVGRLVRHRYIPQYEDTGPMVVVRVLSAPAR